jgi:hypothetical protein
MVRGFAEGVKPSGQHTPATGIAKGTLLFSGLGLTNVRQKTRMRGAELSEIGPRLTQAELPVHRQANFRGVLVFLAVILPPANGAQFQSAWRFEGLISTARAAKTNCDGSTHMDVDGISTAEGYAMSKAICRLHGLLMPFKPLSMEFPE